MKPYIGIVLAAFLTFAAERQSFSADDPRYALIHVFTNAPSDGGRPGELFRSREGIIWGVTGQGGNANGGTLFSLNLDGSAYTVLAHLSLSGAPKSILQGSDGRLYVLVRNNSSTNGADSIVRLNPDGSNPTVLHRFDAVGDGRSPTDLIQGSDGMLYGCTAAGGVYVNPGLGTVFKLNPDGSGYRILRSFSIAPGEGGQVYGLMEGSDGWLYGTCASESSLVKLQKNGSGFAVVHIFNRNEGLHPHARLIEDSDGALYGTCTIGGAYDKGTIFRMARSGSNFAVLHTFGSLGRGDAEYPHGRLLEGTDGALYGTTGGGGSANMGTVFRINKDGTEYRILHSFLPDLGDSGQTYVGLIEGNNGLLFGTTAMIRIQADGFTQYGTIFQVQGPIGPPLRAEWVGRSLTRLSWPSSWTGFALEETDSLNGGVWARTIGTAENDRINQSVQVEVSAGTRFYRLVKPQEP